MQYWKYTPADLEKQKMYALLPLQVFKSRKKIDSIYESKRPEEEKAQLINQEFEKLKETVAEVLNILNSKFDTVPGDLKEKILSIEDESKLDNLFMAVIKSDSISDIYRMI